MKVNRVIVISMILILPVLSFAQIIWLRTYHGGNGYDAAVAIAVDSAGNVYVTGTSTENYNYATLKYNPSGIVQWISIYDGPSSSMDVATAMDLDHLANVYVTGRSRGLDIDYDYLTVKYDSTGAEQWVARYDGPSNDTDDATAISVDNEGNVYVTGYCMDSISHYDYTTIKYDSSGIEQWITTYTTGPNSSCDRAWALAVDGMGNVYVTGTGDGGVNTAWDYATIKYNSSGVEQWVARYSGPGSQSDLAYALAIDSSGNVYVTGESDIGGGSYTDFDFVTVKYDSLGVEQWVARYSGQGIVGFNHDTPNDIAVDSEGNIYVTGVSRNDSTNADYTTVKYDSTGAEQWVARYDGQGNPSNGDAAKALAVDSAGNVYVTGQSAGQGNFNVDYVTIKYDFSGIEQWVERFDNQPWCYLDAARAIALDKSGYVYVTGRSYWNSVVEFDYLTIKYSCVGGVEESKSKAKHKVRSQILHIFPNPFIKFCSIALYGYEPKQVLPIRIYNISGRLIETTQSTGAVIGENLKPGVYFLIGEGYTPVKIVKLK